jgi:aspartate kinase
MSMEQVVIRGVSIERNQAKVTLRQVADKPGIASQVFKAIANAGIAVDMIVQNVSLAGTTDISFTLNKDDLPKAQKALEPLTDGLGKGVSAQDGIAKLSVVGIGMRSHSGVAAKVFEALSLGGINIQMISTSEIKIAVVVDEDKITEAANLVHEAFGLSAE